MGFLVWQLRQKRFWGCSMAGVQTGGVLVEKRAEFENPNNATFAYRWSKPDLSPVTCHLPGSTVKMGPLGLSPNVTSCVRFKVPKRINRLGCHDACMRTSGHTILGIRVAKMILVIRERNKT